MKLFFTFFAALLISSSVFGQTENFWTKRNNFGVADTATDLSIKRERAIAFSINDLGYVGTGVDTAELVNNDLWQYDPLTNAWTQMASLPGLARRNAMAFAINGKGYVGMGMSHAESAFGNTLSDFWEYDPTGNTWTLKATFPGGGIYFGTGFSVGNKGYLCGGKYGPNFYSDLLWEYDPVTDAWTNISTFPGGVRYQLSSFVVGNSAYIGLGTDQDMYRNDIWEYKPSTNQWTQKSNLPASERSSSHTFSIGSKGFICMGGNGGYLDDLWEYDPIADSWTSRASYGGSKRKNGIAFEAYGKGYVGLGKGQSGKKGSFWEYTPSSSVGINEAELADISISPNPANEVININTNSKEIASLEIISLQGKTVMQSDYTSSLLIDGVAPGTYFVTGINAQGEVIGKEKLIIR